MARTTGAPRLRRSALGWTLATLASGCEIAERVWAGRGQLAAPRRAAAAFALARARWARGEADDRSAARGLVEEALGLWTSISAGDGDDARTAREWLSAHAVP